MEEQLDDSLYSQILELCEAGDTYQESEQFAEAIDRYLQAFNMIPHPKYQWEASTWILTALGETYLFTGDYEKARHTLEEAMKCPGAIGNPFIHLRLGEAQFESGSLDQAAEEFTGAYMLEGEEIFEDEDPKYFAFLKTKIRM